MNLTKKIIAIVTALTVFSLVGSPVLAALTETQIQSIVNLLESFGADTTTIANVETSLRGGQPTTPTVTGCTIASFAQNLKQGMTGADVKCLQIILNSATDTKVATTGAGSPGSETTYFGALTKAAVIKFQEKYASEILASYGLTTGTGFVGSTTRAKLNTLIGVTPPGVVCGNGVCETGETNANCPADCVPVTEGVVNVALAGETPATAVLALGAVGMPVAIFNLTSGADATLNTIKFTRSGVGATTDYSNVYIYEGATRLKSGRTISADSETVEFTNIGLALSKGKTTKLTVKVDVYSSAAAGNIDILSIAKAGDISITGATIKGTFPIGANYMTFSTLSVGTVTIANGGSVSKPTLGQTEGKVAEIKITAGANDIDIVGMTLGQNGSISNSNLSNLKLKVGSTVLATAASMTGEKVVLTLGTPYKIAKSQNKTLDLYADILGGKTTDTIRFYLDESSDIQITDKQYGQGSAITNSFGASTAYCVGAAASNTCPTTGSLQGGVITLADNGPAAITVATNTTNVALLNFGFTSSRNVTVRDYDLLLTATNKYDSVLDGTETFVIGTSEDIVMDGQTGTLAIGDYVIIATTSTTSYVTASDVIAKVTATNGTTTASVTPVAGTDLTAANNSIVSTVLKITAVRLTDTATGNVVYSDSTARYFDAGALTSSLAVSDDFDVNAAQTRPFSLRIDIHTYSAAGMTINGNVDFSTASRVKDYESNEFISTSDIVPNTLTGKNMTTGAAGLTVALASTPVSGVKVKGTNDVDVLGISLTAGSSGNVKLTSLIVRFIADTDATFAGGIGVTRPNTAVGSVSLYDGSTKIAGPKSIVDASWISGTSGYYTATFDNLAYNILAGSSQKLTVKVDLKNTISTETFLVATVAPASDVEAEDADGNSLTLSNATYGGINEDSGDATVLNDTTPPVQIDVKTAGTLTVAVEGSPDAAIVVAGSTQVVMAKYKLSALYENFTIDKLEVASDTDATPALNDDPSGDTANDNNIVRIGVKAGGVTYWSNLSAGLASFSGLGITVPADGSIYVEILVDLNTIAGGATSGESPRLGINSWQNAANTFRAVGVGSSTTLTYTTLSSVSGESDIKAMTLRKTKPTVIKATGMSTTLINGSNTLYGFTVTADSGAAVSLRRIALTTSFSDDLDVNGLKFYRGSSDITSDVSIRNEDGQNLKVGGSNLVTNTGTATSDIVYITWDKAAANEEIVSAGTSKTYYLKGTVASAGAAESISFYIADDTAAGTTTTTGAGVATLRTSTATSGETAAASVNNTRTIWRWASATTAYLDINGSGDYEAATDYLVTTVTTSTGDAAYTVDQIIPGTLKYTTDDVDGGGSGDAGIYFDLDGDGNYVAASDLSIAVTIPSTVGNFTDDALIAQEFVYDATGTKLYINTNGAKNSAYATADDTDILGETIPTTAPTDGDEAYTLSMNFVWSDNSNTSHTTSTVDWMNGYLVEDLATDTLTLSY